jgi:hypothetical protein
MGSLPPMVSGRGSFSSTTTAARQTHGRIGLGRNDQAERLQIRGDPQMGLVRTAGQDFAEILGMRSGVIAHNT